MPLLLSSSRGVLPIPMSLGRRPLQGLLGGKREGGGGQADMWRGSEKYGRLSEVKSSEGQTVFNPYVNISDPGCPVLAAKLSELMPSDWLLGAWCNNDLRCLCPLWSWRPLLQPATGGCGLLRSSPNELSVGLMGNSWLPWRLLSPTHNPYNWQAGTSTWEHGRRQSFTSRIYHAAQRSPATTYKKIYIHVTGNVITCDIIVSTLREDVPEAVIGTKC